MELEKIIPIATYLFKQMRTEAKFLHISQIKGEGGLYIFYGCFQGKKRRIYKKLVLDKKGNIIR